MTGDEHVVAVKDTFEIRPKQAGVEHVAGLVVVFDGRQCGFDLPHIGANIEFIRPDGKSGQAIIGEIKEHGDGRSFFFENLHVDDLPIGSVLQWIARTSLSSPQTKLVVNK